MSRIRGALVLLHLLAAASAALGGVSCPDTDLVVYGLTFETFWTRQKFPKQYPEFRPPAHWSKLIGMTHDDGYILFRVGEMATREMKTFAETGKTDAFAPATNHTFDEFYSPSIKSGAGKTEVNFFADGNHTMVSLAVKIVPSPDWFVGVDSLALCSGGEWIDSATVRGAPIDAGTDSGFTFTAPNWATDPQEKITEITSRHPRHPANSFYYPAIEDLPAIASFRIRKRKLYRLVRSREEASSDNEIIQRKPAKKRKPKKYKSAKCRMASWSQWSDCSASCGSGYATRSRKSLHPSRCPTATERKKCFTLGGCYSKPFKW